MRYAAWLFHERHSKIDEGEPGVVGGYDAIKEAANQRSRSISESARDIAAEGWVHERFTRDWIDSLGFPIRFFSAFDRRDVEAGRIYFTYEEAAAKRRTGRPLTAGEIACATSHALVMHEEMEFCGPEGVFILEDDCVPLLGANEIVRRVQTAATALPGVEVIAGHEPNSRYTFSEQAGGAVRINRPPWGSILTWYSPQGLHRAYDILTRMEIPTDWLWRDLAAQGKFALLTPPVAGHDGGTTYIGNEHRGVTRRYIC